MMVLNKPVEMAEDLGTSLLPKNLSVTRGCQIPHQPNEAT